ncbi:MAG: hypothetical protein Q9192_006680 [Flavoplaca navasiana]
MDVSNASDGLGDRKLLETIDKLAELHIGESVALPQGISRGRFNTTRKYIVQADTDNSGKSSVLEGLTGLPFPRDSTLCTRFATHISFRRAPTFDISVSIIPSKGAGKEDAARMKGWNKSGMTSLDRQSFSGILKEVHKVMGIGSVDSGALISFSDDVLKIEVVGPSQEHLSVVDVPGIFRKITEGFTTQIDIANVRAMAERYMDNPRCVILAVVPANVDIATQEILEMASKYDMDGKRTLGVLTKLDLVDKGAENNVISLIQGTSHMLNLGWCMVKNPGQQDLQRGDDFDRHASETFFKNHEIWSKIDKDRVGIRSLRLRLVEVLTSIVRKEFNQVRLDVNQQLQLKEKALNAMGPSRESKEKQQKYLLHIADRYQTMTIQALEAHYGSDDAFDSIASLKLATVVVDRNESFSHDMWRNGHTMEFVHGATGKHVEPPAAAPAQLSKEPDSGKKVMATRYEKDPEALKGMLYDWRIWATPDNGIMSWIEKVYKGSRGFEIGTFDASLIPIMWKKQSSKWEPLAIGYISDIISIIQSFIVELLMELCPDSRVANGLQELIQEKLTERYHRALDQTRSNLRVEGEPMTYNHYLADNLKKCNHQRIKTSMQSKQVYDAKLGYVVKISDLDHIASLSNLESSVEQLHDILKSYYKVARKRFVDNVCMQAADLHLVRGPDAAVKVLTPAFVSDLTAEQLEHIAGETKSSRKKRGELVRLVDNLSQAKILLATV